MVVASRRRGRRLGPGPMDPKRNNIYVHFSQNIAFNLRLNVLFYVVVIKFTIIYPFWFLGLVWAWVDPLDTLTYISSGGCYVRPSGIKKRSPVAS